MSEQTSNPTSGQNVPKSKFRRKSRQEQTAASKLRMERRVEKLDAAREKLAKQKPPKKPGAVKRLAHTAGHGVHGFVHGKLYEVEHENVGTEGAHRSELVAESVYRFGRRKLRKAIRGHPAKAVERAESKHIKATADYYYRKTVEEHPEMQEGGAVSRYLQKQKIKRQYAKQAREAARQTGKAAEGTASVTGKLTERVSAYIKEHPGGLLLLLAAFLLLVVLQSCMSSLVTVGNGVAGAIGASTYAAEDADLLGAEAAYCALEDELQRYLDTYTRTHDYDEYHFDLDTIEHDPYVLLSIVCALHEGEWTLDEVRGTLQMLFDRQYILTEDVVVERRYYLETDTWTDEDGNTHSDTYRVYYDYYICTVTLENFNLSHLPVYIMGEETLSRYALYMATLGNRPDLFPSSPYVGKYTNKPPAHEIPEDYLVDETFAAILKEAEKYVGYYEISEAAAKRAKDMNSYSDYAPGSATAGYQQMVDEAYALAEKQKAQVDPMYHDKIDALVDRYARRLAENLNERNAIDARVPSILITGGGNFPVAKKAKQNAARDRNYGEYAEIEKLLDKIRSTGRGGISADDDLAVEKLTKKLEGMESQQAMMKAVNAYYRKHKTLEGCPELTAEQVEKIKASMSQDWRKDPVPFPSYLLTNNNANIRRVRQRIEDLSHKAEFVGWTFPGGEAKVNEAENRLQLIFEDKPDADTRQALKSEGFKWAPSQGAWQRQLNQNAIRAAARLDFLRPEDGKSPYQLQPFAKRVDKDVSR